MRKYLRLFMLCLFGVFNMASWAQDKKEDYQDSLSLDSSKSCPDTIRLELYPMIHSLSFDDSHKYNTTKKQNNFKLQKFDPYKKKFFDLQIFDAIRPHISR